MDQSGPVIWRSRFNLYELLCIYDTGRAFLQKRHHGRWKETFALGVSCGGVLTGEEGTIGMLSVFWRTDNPVVDLRYKVPAPVADGEYAYVGWLWNAYGKMGVLALRSHIASACPGAKYIAHHDHRSKASQKRSETERARGNGRLIVKPMRTEQGQSPSNILSMAGRPSEVADG